MASGSSSSHSKLRRPGKSNTVTSSAAGTPMATTPRPTISASCTVTHRYSGSTVAAISRRICAVSAFHCVQEPITISTGSASAPASSTRIRVGATRTGESNRIVIKMRAAGARCGR
jgi:hypothetical protein